MLERRQRVAHPGARIAGRLDQHVEAAAPISAMRVVAEVGAAVRQRRPQVGRGELLRGPAGRQQRAPRPRRLEIGHAQDVQAGRMARLSEEHGAELAGADHADPDRLAGRGPARQQTVQVHARPSLACANPVKRQDSAPRSRSEAAAGQAQLGSDKEKGGRSLPSE